MQVVVNDQLVSYDETRPKATKIALFLHGWGSNKETFKTLTADFEEDYRCIAVDLPGFGASELPKEAWGVPEYADFVRDFAAKLNVTPEVIVGHSLGGRIAVYLAGSNLFADAHLVLLGAAGFSEKADLRTRVFALIAKLGKVVTAPLPDTFKKRLQAKLYRSAGTTDYLDAGEMRTTFSKIIDLDLTDHARKITNETLLVYGESDDQTPPSYGERYHGLIKVSRLKIIPGGHYIHLDQPKRTLKLIQEFLA